MIVVFLKDLAVFNSFPKLTHHCLCHVALFTDHDVVLIVRVVCIAQSPIWPELELEELVAKLALMAYIVPDIELVFASHRGGSVSSLQTPYEDTSQPTANRWPITRLS